MAMLKKSSHQEIGQLIKKINKIDMKNLAIYQVRELGTEDLRTIEGGVIPWPAIVAAVAAVGAAAAWCFEKGEELGKAMA